MQPESLDAPTVSVGQSDLSFTLVGVTLLEGTGDGTEDGTGDDMTTVELAVLPFGTGAGTAGVEPEGGLPLGTEARTFEVEPDALPF